MKELVIDRLLSSTDRYRIWSSLLKQCLNNVLSNVVLSVAIMINISVTDNMRAD